MNSERELIQDEPLPKSFEVDASELMANIEVYVSGVFADLTSSFLMLPKGPTFIEYGRFEEAYEGLKRRTSAFRRLDTESVLAALADDALILVVMRAILGMTPPEWAELTRELKGIAVPQGWARALEGQARRQPDYCARMRGGSVGRLRVEAMVATACHYITAPAPEGAADMIYRLKKIDTSQGVTSVQNAADRHVPYAALLYERYLGRPFASHKDAVSELVGDVMESAIEEHLRAAHITFRKTARAERLPGFDQAPDFVIPTEIEPRVAIEAKIAGDDGTARDKVSRILRLCALSKERVDRGEAGFQVVACIDGRGFGVRREDMRQLLRETDGKVFTAASLHQLIGNTEIHRYLPDAL